MSELVTLDLSPQISLGDVQSNYLLTTAENELGVVVAHSEAGEKLLKWFCLKLAKWQFSHGLFLKSSCRRSDGPHQLV